MVLAWCAGEVVAAGDSATHKQALETLAMAGRVVHLLNMRGRPEGPVASHLSLQGAQTANENDESVHTTQGFVSRVLGMQNARLYVATTMMTT